MLPEGTTVTGQPPAGGTPPEGSGSGNGNLPAGGTPTTGSGNLPALPQTWDAFLETLTPEVKALYEQHTSGLKSALQSERDQRSDLAKQLKEMAGKQKEGSDERKALDEMSKSLEEANARADFFEDAARPEIGCRNPKLAWLAAQTGEGYVRRGKVDWLAIKADYPELFQAATSASSRGNAGSGTGNQQPVPETMDDFIRRKAGVK